MIEYLEKLIADKEWQKALDYAEKLLLTTEHSTKDMVAIECAVLGSRLQLGDYTGAVVAGETALRLASDIKEWDYFGLACMDLGVAYYYLGDLDQAIYFWLEFLTGLMFYKRSAQYEARVRYNVGLLQTARGDFAAACRTMEEALYAAHRLGAEQLAQGIRLALVGSLLKAGQLQRIPRLLAQCGRYVRYHRDTSGMRETELWHKKARIEYTVETNRVAKARRLALQALIESEERPRHQFVFHMMLARMALQLCCEEEAAGHAVAARIEAIRCHRQDLQSEADEFLYQFMTSHSGIMQALDQYLLDSVLPIVEEFDNQT
jgi:tetratricopeptide (TPR) repeat protein